ncbi:MAG TPA: hypothetical protein VFG20_07090 [Planctomycetaceae bacterium]|nr:hypothetical protein [Planctomycetaceae bacterium]
MARAEAAALCYGELACLSQERSQPLMRDRFLLLAAAAACRAGWPEVAEECHGLLRTFAPQHQAARFVTIADGLRDAEFAKVVQHWERFCPMERAEMLLTELGTADVLDADDPDAAEALLQRLQRTFPVSG